MSEIVFELIALILQRVECFVLNLPASTTTTHDLVNIVAVEQNVRHPTEMDNTTIFVLLTVKVYERLANFRKLSFWFRRSKQTSRAGLFPIL